jgi:soluble lytic murein transglycosylase-like protein
LTCEGEIVRAARIESIPVNVLYAVGLAETGRRGQLQPFDMNIDGRPSHPGTLNAALAAFASARAAGARSIDIGCLQINYRWHGGAFSSVAEMFEPRANVDYGAKFLRELRRREGSWTLAVARYNAGPDNDAAQKQYVCRVIGKMVESGLGNWTPTAMSFCR